MLQVLSAIKLSAKRSTSLIAPSFPLFYNLPFNHSRPARALPRIVSPSLFPCTPTTPYTHVPKSIACRAPERSHLASYPSHTLLTSARIPQRSSKMVYTHGTPYVTPHILHKHYAQAHDAEVSIRELYALALHPFQPLTPSNLSLVIGREIEYFSQAGFDMDRIQIKRNAPPAVLYEDAIRNEGAIVSSSGALINFSGKKTGRSPKDKRIVYEDTSKDEIWWGSVNIKMDERKRSFRVFVKRERRVNARMQTPSRSTVSVPSTTSTHEKMSMCSTATPA